MAVGEPPEKYVLRVHLTEITDAVELNLEVVGTRLAENSFITSRQVHNIVGVLGPTAASKASNLMRSVEAKIDVSDKREEWFEKFVHILANDTAADELVKKLTRDLVKKKPRYRGDLLKYVGKPQAEATQAVNTSSPPTDGLERISRTSEPDLITLMSFPKAGGFIDITTEIGGSYSKFGIFLLNDKKRALVAALEKAHSHDAAEINQAIFGKWLEGVNEVAVTWDWLVNCLKRAGLHALAKEVESGLKD